jgi:GNAT superfamily N-acetyltransferase
VIRAATVRDAPAIVRIQRRGWQHAYADFVDPERMVAEPIEQSERRWRELLAGAGHAAWVWDQDGAIAAFASAGRARDADADADTGELYAIYVDPPAQGAGVGGALLDTAEGWLRDEGYAEATLWSFTDNGLARSIYERRGWVLDDPESTARAHGEGWWAPAVRYRLRLG